MRLGYIAYAFDRPLSGITRYSIELLRALSSLDNAPEIFVLTAGSMGPLADLGLHQIPLRGCERLPLLLTIGSAYIRQIIAHYNLDAVHDPTGINPFVLGKGTARTIVTIHDVIPLSFPGVSTRLDTMIYRHWLPRIAPKTDAIITVSQASKDDIAQYLRLPVSRIHAIPIAVGQNYQPIKKDVVAQVLNRYALPQDYILYVGSVEERKNLQRVLQAYYQLKRQGITNKLVIVGARKWHYEQILRLLDTLGLYEDVIITGYVNDNDLPAIYSGAKVFVFPSLYEGFGLPVLEAMACGTPVITSNISSLPEVAGEAALLINPYDVDMLAHTMYQVLRDPNLHDRLTTKSLDRAKMFHWRTTAQATLSIYEQLTIPDIGYP